MLSLPDLSEGTSWIPFKTSFLAFGSKWVAGFQTRVKRPGEFISGNIFGKFIKMGILNFQISNFEALWD